MNEIKSTIKNTIKAEKVKTENAIESLSDKCTLTDYSGDVYEDRSSNKVWTKALQKALDEHEVVIIPPSDDVYFIDDSVIIPSNRRIVAYGAVVRLVPECLVLMFRNKNTLDGTKKPINPAVTDHNIAIEGGSFEESNTKRGGYGKNAMYDKERSFFGVSTLFLFNNIEGLILKNVNFAHTAGFSVQTGDITNAFFENITFTECYADGLHLNGNSKNILARNIKGQVGDDLVALNMYDWQNSSVNFGPTENVLCEDLELSETSRYKALRIEPGTYFYEDGSSVDCSLRNCIIRNVKGIMTFKMYYQTPPYRIDSEPEKGKLGSADNIFFEDIAIDLEGPIDSMTEYLDSDPIRGNFGAFELGSVMGYVSFKNIDITLHKDKYPLSYLVTCGPKSCRWENNTIEVFDPYFDSSIECLEFSNIRVNGKRADNIENLIKTVSFENVNNDGRSTASGKIDKIILDGRIINKD